jgi:hypothetical protein
MVVLEVSPAAEVVAVRRVVQDRQVEMVAMVGAVRFG